MSEVNMVSNTPRAQSVQGIVNEAQGNISAVSWAAIFAGAAGAAALSLILVILGIGFGFTVVSPWSMEGAGVATIGFAAVLWLSFTQIAASGMGGYLAGRLRTKWTGVHSDEVYFRDTAHGFLTWAVATLVTVALVTSVVGAATMGMANLGSKAIGAGVGSAAALTVSASDNGDSENVIEYYIDSMFRSGQLSSESRNAQTEDIPSAEVLRITLRALRNEELEQQDERYIGQLVAQHTDLSQQAAQQRVASSFSQLQATLNDAEVTVRQHADNARKATAYAALWMFIALLMGAFSASLAAVFGGRQRDA